MVDKHKNSVGIFLPSLWEKRITIIWVGWVGSITAYFLTQMWCTNIHIVDMDQVEIHNTTSQFYKQSDIGINKVDALKDNLLAFNGVEVSTKHGEYVTADIAWSEIVIIAVDNMDVRKQIMEDCVALWVPYAIEARMSGELFRIYSLKPTVNYDLWLMDWYPQSEAAPEICTEKSISYNTWMIWSIITKIASNMLWGKDYPYHIEMEISTLNFVHTLGDL